MIIWCNHKLHFSPSSPVPFALTWKQGLTQSCHHSMQYQGLQHIVGFQNISQFFNLHDISPRCPFLCRATQKLRNSSVFYDKTKDTFKVKICICIRILHEGKNSEGSIISLVWIQMTSFAPTGSGWRKNRTIFCPDLPWRSVLFTRTPCTWTCIVVLTNRIG